MWSGWWWSRAPFSIGAGSEEPFTAIETRKRAVENAPVSKATYRASGVDIDEGDRLVELIKPLAAPTHRPEVLAGIGGFGGLFALPSGYREPVLVAGTDGVGTKLKVAFMADRHSTVGIDLVAMSVNDVCVTGAEPLFFLDYFATSGLKAEQAAEVVRGIAEGCLQSGCALLGGETAELPGFYRVGEYDLAGFAVGVVERSQLIDGRRAKAGDAVLGIASSGLHSNGFSLARQVLLETAAIDLRQRLPELGGRALVDVLLEPTRIYARAIARLRAVSDVRALAHITGGGLPGNLPRVLPAGLCAELKTGSWPRAPIFDLIQSRGDVTPEEMYRTFNMGIGLCAVLPKADVAGATAALAELDLPAFAIGVLKALDDPRAEALVRFDPELGPELGPKLGPAPGETI
jgi:phosphoribosylformylglycinamidine cyclo-ligase